MGKLYSVAAGVFVATLIASAVQADGPDISAQHLLSSWRDDPNMRMVAEVIASAFASGFSWGGDAAGKRGYCASPDIKGGQIMSAFEEFLRENPKMADQPLSVVSAFETAGGFRVGRISGSS
jgi:hypothetical protein